MPKYHIWFAPAVHARALAGLLAAVAISGCGGSDPATVAVAGDSSQPTPALETPSDGVAPAGGEIGTPATGPVGAPDETPADDAPADETPAEETPAEETPAPAVDEPADETPAAPAPAAPADEAPAPAAPTTPYPLPTLPAEVASIRWPTAPAITRTVTARTLAEATTAAATAGTRVHVEGAIAGTIEVRANDVEIEFAPGATATAVLFGKALARVAVRGGTVDHVETELPAIYEGGALQFRPELLTTDIMVDGVTAHADDTAFLMRAGIRVAVVNSTGTAGRYTLWFGDTGDFESEDVIIAGNDFASQGPEATFRLVHVVRSVSVDNRIENVSGQKHNYRTHGRSENNYASGNVLVNSGIMMGTMDTDFIGRQWFVNNTIHHTTPSLLEIHLDTPDVTIRGNTIYTDVWTCLLCRDTPAGWTIEDNDLLPYRPAPAR